MNRLKPSFLFIGVLTCVPLLILYRLGIFHELGKELAKEYAGHLLLPPSGLQAVVPFQYLYYTAAAFLTAWVCTELARDWQRLSFTLGLSFLTATLSAVLAFKGILFEPFSGILATVGAGIAASIFGQTERGRRIHAFRKFFVGRLNEETFEKLIVNRDPVKLTSRRGLTSLTCRMLNNSDLAAYMEAQDLEQMSSAFTKAVSDYLVERGAYLDVCNSQGITVQLGFPVAAEDHALTACRLAMETRTFLTDLAAELEKRWHHRPTLGIALASGDCACGLIGHGEFQFYSALGEAPEMSRRLCNMNGVYGSKVLISAATFNEVKSAVEVRPMELLAAPGQTGLHEVYELLAEKGNLSAGESAARDAFWEGVVALRQGEADAALAKLRQAIVVGKDDPPLRYFKQRAEAQQQDRKSHVRRSEHTS